MAFEYTGQLAKVPKAQASYMPEKLGAAPHKQVTIFRSDTDVSSVPTDWKPVPLGGQIGHSLARCCIWQK